jgi:hypothetical protein
VARQYSPKYAKQKRKETRDARLQRAICGSCCSCSIGGWVPMGTSKEWLRLILYAKSIFIPAALSQFRFRVKWPTSLRLVLAFVRQARQLMLGLAVGRKRTKESGRTG